MMLQTKCIVGSVIAAACVLLRACAFGRAAVSALIFRVNAHRPGIAVRLLPRRNVYDRFGELVGVPGAFWGGLSFVFSCQALECSAIHLAASCSVTKPLIASVSPSGHSISTPQPNPGFFLATKVGRCSDIVRVCAYGLRIQASHPATIKLTGLLPPRNSNVLRLACLSRRSVDL
jgi:hypothetical protein